MANKIYVELNGDDSNLGTKDNPVATISKAREIASTEGDTIYIGSGIFEVNDIVGMSKQNITLNYIGTGKDTIIVVQNNPGGVLFYGNMNLYKMIIKPANTFSGDTRTVFYTKDTYAVKFYNCVFLMSDDRKFPTNAFMYVAGRGTSYVNKDAYACLFLSNIRPCNSGFIKCYNCASSSTADVFNIECIQGVDCQYNVTVDDNYYPTNYNKYSYGVYFGDYGWDNYKYIIKQQNKYYTVKQEKYNGNFYDEISLNDIKDNFDDLGFYLSELMTETTIDGETFKPIDKFDEFAFITNANLNNITINGIKSNTEMVTFNNDFISNIHSNIDFLENDIEISGNALIKTVFSIDEGVTWKTHDGNEFIDLNINIPCKPYDELTQDELLQWNDARDKIFNEGINVTNLKALDFNALDFNKIRFSWVLYINKTKDVALNKRLFWQFDVKDTMLLMKDSEIDIEVLPTGIKVTPKVNSELIKLNIATNGIVGDSIGGTNIENGTWSEANTFINSLF